MNCDIEEGLDIDAEIMKAHLESEGWENFPHIHRKSPFESTFLYIVFASKNRSVAIPLPEKSIYNKHRFDVSDDEREYIQDRAVDVIMNCYSLIRTADGARTVLNSLSRFVNIGLGDESPFIIGNDKIHFVLHVSIRDNGCLTLNSAVIQDDRTILNRYIIEQFAEEYTSDD